jgi:predicted nucleic acid-binding protein
MQKRIYLDSVTIIYLLENTAKKPAVLSVLRTPDALHLAYASTGRCEVILAGDQQLATEWNQKRPLPFPISAVLV